MTRKGPRAQTDRGAERFAGTRGTDEGHDIDRTAPSSRRARATPREPSRRVWEGVPRGAPTRGGMTRGRGETTTGNAFTNRNQEIARVPWECSTYVHVLCGECGATTYALSSRAPRAVYRLRRRLRMGSTEVPIRNRRTTRTPSSVEM